MNIVAIGGGEIRQREQSSAVSAQVLYAGISMDIPIMKRSQINQTGNTACSPALVFNRALSAHTLMGKTDFSILSQRLRIKTSRALAAIIMLQSGIKAIINQRLLPQLLKRR